MSWLNEEELEKKDNLNFSKKKLNVIKVSDKEGSTREYTILVNKNSILDLSFLKNIEFKWIILMLEFITILVLLLIIIFRGGNKPRKPKKIKSKVSKPKSVVKMTANVCKACGTVNDMKSKTCYVCGNLLK